ncbi:phosphoribosylglycinamide formyltransferase [uncultured Desulfuromusa sp.]|uniref:phosphoribosylglycinamide formyltransferase n=1 Tax=uncultured Desulfuromusa sp. TaxID=219183 RepID=UPI002AA87659|nr:phosphoribosylglycinamide formyltransferase [uncultured Desulfuromusa sp.]
MTLNKKLRVAVLASGGGTNLQSIIDQSQEGILDAEICLVLSNNQDAGALKRAQQAGIETLCIDHRDFKTREQFDQTVVAALKKAGTELVVLAGFMRIISEIFLQAFPQKIINIHPALLPAFPGLHVQQKAIEYGAKFSGCTVHFVDAGVDTGPIIAQAIVPIFNDDNEEILAARILEQEHKIYPQAIQWIAEKRVKIEGRCVHIEDSKNVTAAFINPPIR